MRFVRVNGFKIDTLVVDITDLHKVRVFRRQKCRCQSRELTLMMPRQSVTQYL